MISDNKSITRRSFMNRNLQTAAGLAVLGGISSTTASAARKKVKMRFGFTTYKWGKDWDIPTLIANCQKAKAFGLETRTSQSYAHGIELELSAKERREVKKQFKGSPVTLVGLACSERFDSPEPEKLKAAIENAKGYMKLSHDVGGSGVRVFPNDFHDEVPHEKTIAQIAKSVNEVGVFAAEYGQQVRLEAHGSAGELPTLRAIMDQVDQPNVRIKLNSSSRDNEGEGYIHNFNLVKHLLGDTLHMHDITSKDFPYQLQVEQLIKIDWDGWWLVEQSAQVPDRLQALIEYQKIWQAMVDKALKK